MDKRYRIFRETTRMYREARDKHKMVKDRHIRKMAVKINADVKLDNFNAGHSWVTRFKRLNGITDRKVTKFVTARFNGERAEREEAAAAHVALIKPLLVEFGRDNVFNADQSPVLKELHSGRTAATVGQCHFSSVFCQV